MIETTQKVTVRFSSKPALDSLNENFRRVHPDKKSNSEPHSTYLKYFNPDNSWEACYDEFERTFRQDDNGDLIEDIQVENGLGKLLWEKMGDIYSIVRYTEPETLIEIGVCDGFSAWAILMALYKNQKGHLYPLDFPYFADKPLDELSEQTFDGFGGSPIPIDKDLGWIVPKGLKRRWDLRVGKSQEVLPGIVSDVEGFNLFFHDSKHSRPCMMLNTRLPTKT